MCKCIVEGYLEKCLDEIDIIKGKFGTHSTAYDTAIRALVSYVRYLNTWGFEGDISKCQRLTNLLLDSIQFSHLHPGTSE